MIYLEEIKDLDPFTKYPQLKTIWPDPFNAIMQEAYYEDLLLKSFHPHFDLGNMSYIKSEDGTVIGITGMFIIPDSGNYEPINPNLEEGYLRWHGIIPEERRKGYSELAMTLLLTDITSKYKHFKNIIELVPQTEYGIHIEAHFKHLGFTKVGEKEKYDWIDCEWQPFHLDTVKYLHNHDAYPKTTKLPLLKKLFK